MLSFTQQFFRHTCISVCGLAMCLMPTIAQADGIDPAVRLGSQEVSLSAGPMVPWRVKHAQSSKLFGIAAMPSWSIGLTDPIGQGWYEGQLRLGMEIQVLRTDRPVVTESVAATPKLTYVFTNGGRWRPFVEGGGGPMWSELGGRIPEQPGWFNFLVFGGGGLSYAMTPHLSLVMGGRFAHISNGGTRPTNRGVNYGLPYVGLSWTLF